MENAFDLLSKNLARVSRRQVLGAFLRGAVGMLLASGGLKNRFARAASSACPICGSCWIQNATTGALEACTSTCEAQTICNDVQKYAQYAELVAVLEGNYYKAEGYSVLFSVNGTSVTTIFQTIFVNPQSATSTGYVFVVVAPNGQVAAYAAEYQNGYPVYGYLVQSSGIQQIVPPPQPFMISASPASTTVSQGSTGTAAIATSVSPGFSAAIGFGISGLPSGVTAAFSPTYLPAPGSGSSTLTLAASASAPAGTYTLGVGGEGGGITEISTISLTVNAAGAAPNQQDVSRAVSKREERLLIAERKSGADGLSISNAQSANCPIACTAIGKAAGYAAGAACASVIASVGVAACLDLPPPLSAACLLRGFQAFGPAVYLCKEGASAAAEAICGYFCTCPPCQTPSGTQCFDACADECPNGTCDPSGCSCVVSTCSIFTTPCNPDPPSEFPNWKCCVDPSPQGSGYHCCEGFLCCAVGTEVCCPPVNGPTFEAINGYCCPAGSTCCDDGQYLGCCP